MITYPATTIRSLLHPWDTECKDAPTTIATEIRHDGGGVAFEDFEGMELRFELDRGRPRLLLYTSDVDSPISVRWTEHGFEIDTTDFTSEGGIAVLNPPEH